MAQSLFLVVLALVALALSTPVLVVALVRAARRRRARRQVAARAARWRTCTQDTREGPSYFERRAAELAPAAITRGPRIPPLPSTGHPLGWEVADVDGLRCAVKIDWSPAGLPSVGGYQFWSEEQVGWLPLPSALVCNMAASSVLQRLARESRGGLSVEEYNARNPA